MKKNMLAIRAKGKPSPKNENRVVNSGLIK